MGSIDGGPNDPRHYCTLCNNRTNLNGTANGLDGQPEGDASRELDASRIGQFCTIRGSKGTGTMGNTPVVGGDRESSSLRGAFYLGDGEDNRSELNRNLLYEENMCTFENFCEKSWEDCGEEVGEGGDAGIANFCTLRKKRSISQKAVDTGSGGCGSQSNGSSDVRETSLVDEGVGSYCTLKKKKLKLNQKFVESFLEDPNAKLHDYLSELDAYLDEIDGLDSEGQFSSDDEEVQKEVEEEIEDHAVGGEETSDSPSTIGYIDIENFCTLPKRKRVQFLNAFQRASPLRRTFAAPGHSSSNKETGGNLNPIEGEVITEADESSPVGTAAADRDSVGAENVDSEISIAMEVNLFYFGVLVAILGTLYYLLTKRHGHFHDKPIPSMAAKPILGSVSDLMLQRVPFSTFIQTLYDKYRGVKVFGLFDMMTPTYVIRDPELIKQVAVKDFDHFADHVQAFGNSSYDHPNLLTGKTLFSLTGSRWKTMRATLSPAFTGSKMRYMFELIVECTERAVRYYEENAVKSGPKVYEMKDVFSRFANDVIATCAFGLQVESSRDRDNEFFVNGSKMLDFSRPSVMLRIMGHQLVPWLMAFFGWDVIDEQQNTYFKTLILDAIKEREHRGIVRPDMINLLIQAKKGTLKHQQENEQVPEGFATVQESEVGTSTVTTVMTDLEMVAQCLIFFLAGFDTVSTSLLYASYELAINPEVQQKLYDEIQNTRIALDGKPLTYDAMQKMKYMDMVMSEVLRMWPPAPSTDRLCTKNYVMDEGNGVKYTIEKGTSVWLPIHALHHDPKYYPQPEKFDPERFSDERKGSINAGAYLPFGIGPRNCIGSRFALAEVKTILYYMLGSFSFERCSKTEVPPVLAKGFGVIPANGMHIEFKPRPKK